LADRRVLGDPDRGHLPTPAGDVVLAEERAFGQVHPGDVVAVAADPAAGTPCPVVTAGASQWFVAARTQR
jgi:D-serine deaminase-like pyridoxal phosphate-dependent protein